MTAPAPDLVLADVGESRPCDVHGCKRRAVVALCFRGQRGHVHVCGPCEAIDREWCDVLESRPLPCPYGHDGTMWVAEPKELT